MAIPKHQDLYLAVLEICTDGELYRLDDMVPKIAERFQIPPEEQEELLPSGRETRLRNRVDWAAYNLYRAGLLDKPKRGRYQMGEEGRKVLSDKPDALDDAFLKQYESFREFQSTSRTAQKAEPAEPSVQHAEESTPEEAIEQAHETLKRNLISELMAMLGKMDPYRFERVVLDLLLAMGYGGSRAEAASVTRASGDGGIDGIINEDRLGLETIYVQAKRFQATVPISQVRDFAGALLGQRARKGIFITTSDFPQSAHDFVRNIDQKIILIDGRRLAELMIQHNVGVTVWESYQLKKVDSDYFEEG